MAIFSIARLTYVEAIRQPIGLVLTLFLGLLALFSPSFTAFTLGQDIDLLRSNLLSNLMLGGVIFASLLSTNLIQRDFQRKTLLTILSRPVSIPSYYLGKWLGITALLLHFWFVMVGICWSAMVVGTPDTKTTVINYIPLIIMGLGLGATFIMALILNYTFELPIISFTFGGWAILTPITFLLTHLLTPVLHLPIPETSATLQFFYSAVLVAALILVVSSFSMALSTSTSAVVNMVLCFVFLLLSLMSPGLESLAQQVHPWAGLFSKMSPDFHLLWTADWLSLEKSLPIDHILGSLLYSITLMASFSFMGVYVMMRKDLS